MAQKNEAPILILALLITLGAIGGGIWVFKTPLQNLIGQISGSGNSSQPNRSQPGDAATFGEVSDVPEGRFNYGGSTTWAPIRGLVDPQILSAHPQFELRYTDPVTGAPGSGSGIKMLLAGELDFSQSSRPLKEEEIEEAKNRGFTLNQIPVAIDGIAIAVHPDLNVAGMTVAQLKDIYTGKIANWSELGGADLPIVPYSRRQEEGGTVEFFVDNVLEGEAFGSNIQFIDNTTLALRAVSEDPGGIYYASAPEVVPQCTVKTLAIGRQPDQLVTPFAPPFVPLDSCPPNRNQLNAPAFQSGDYPITRRLYVIVKENGEAGEQAGNAYARLMLTPEGQGRIVEAGFVNIR